MTEYGVYAPLIEHLTARLENLKKNDKPVKECSILAGFSLALAIAKNYARTESEDKECQNLENTTT